VSIFVVPVEGSGTSVADAFRPKYITALGVPWVWCAAPQEWGIAWAAASPAQETSVGANVDAIVVPTLDGNVAVNATKTALEGLGVPAQWVVAGMTYRQVLRIVVGMAAFAQRCNGLGLRLAIAGNLDKTMGQIPVPTRTMLATAADDLGLDRSQVLVTTTVREVLRMMGQQFVSGIGVALGDL
jgi:hypothetical protein